MSTIGVVGAGQMGHGIAHVMLRAGHNVLLLDTSQAFVDAGAKRIIKGLARDVEKARLTEEQRQQAVTRLKTTTVTADLAAADIIIEAVTEKFEAKAVVFRSLEPHCRPETIFASNTSSISITGLAAATQRPTKFVGLHFFNPVPVMKLVEVVPGLQTSPETVEMAIALAASAGKTPVRVNDFPGFVSNRVLMPMINEAVFCLMEGVADAAGVDEAKAELEEIIEFNERNRDEEMPYFGQDLFIKAEAKGPLTEKAYLDALEKSHRLTRTQGIDALMEKFQLDALVAPTGGPAWVTDLVDGDHDSGGSSTPAAMAGYPNINVPVGFVFGLPVGISFFGKAHSEPTLIKLAFAFEQSTRHRRAPQFLPTADLTP